MLQQHCLPAFFQMLQGRKDLIEFSTAGACLGTDQEYTRCTPGREVMPRSMLSVPRLTHYLSDPCCSSPLPPLVPACMQPASVHHRCALPCSSCLIRGSVRCQINTFLFQTAWVYFNLPGLFSSLSTLFSTECKANTVLSRRSI